MPVLMNVAILVITVQTPALADIHPPTPVVAMTQPQPNVETLAINLKLVVLILVLREVATIPVPMREQHNVAMLVTIAVTPVVQEVVVTQALMPVQQNVEILVIIAPVLALADIHLPTLGDVMILPQHNAEELAINLKLVAQIIAQVAPRQLVTPIKSKLEPRQPDVETLAILAELKLVPMADIWHQYLPDKNVHQLLMPDKHVIIAVQLLVQRLAIIAEHLT